MLTLTFNQLFLDCSTVREEYSIEVSLSWETRVQGHWGDRNLQGMRKRAYTEKENPNGLPLNYWQVLSYRCWRKDSTKLWKEQLPRAVSWKKKCMKVQTELKTVQVPKSKSEETSANNWTPSIDFRSCDFKVGLLHPWSTGCFSFILITLKNNHWMDHANVQIN